MQLMHFIREILSCSLINLHGHHLSGKEVAKITEEDKVKAL